jgi:hypothetical protein
MAFYPGLSLADVASMSNEDKLVWQHHKRRIEARRRLEFISDVGTLLAKEDQAQPSLIALVNMAYGDDEKQLADALESVSRR